MNWSQRHLNAALVALLGCLASAPAFASFMLGDIFASYGNGTVGVYDSSGAFKQTLDTGTRGYETGSVVDSSTGHFYVTDFSGSSVSHFDNNGNLVGTFGSGYSTPEDIAVDAAGNFFVSDLGGNFQKFNSSGTLLQSWSLGRIDWFDLSSDENTLYYTDEGGAIHRYDLQNNSALSDFASTGAQYAIRLLSNGNVLGTSSGAVTLFDSSGNPIRTYNPGDGNLFGMNIEADGTSFITGGINSGNIYRYDIASGSLLQTISTAGPNSGSLWGLSIYGEATVVNPPSDGGGGNSVPEPATWTLMFAGVVLLLVSQLKRKTARMDRKAAAS